MRTNRRHIWVLALIPIVALMGCNLPRQDTAAIQTVAALTVQAALTASAPSATPTFTAVPSQAPATVGVPSATLPAVPTAISSCDKASLASETVVDGTTFSGGNDFVKTWTLKNVGTCSWTPSYSLVFTGGDALGGPANVSLAANVNPGQTITLSLDLEAPEANGTYHGNWGLRNAAGVIFAHFWVEIKVSAGGGTFAVTHVTYEVTGSCGNFHIKANVTTNGPGTVEYYWVFNGTDPHEGTYGSTLNFATAGTKTTPVLDWSISASGDHFAQIYIESPNHQFIGKANVHCP